MMGMIEKHELTLSFNTSEEMWQFLKKHQDKVVGMVDYKVNKWEQLSGKMEDNNGIHEA